MPHAGASLTSGPVRLSPRQKGALALEIVRDFVNVRRQLRSSDLRAALAAARGIPPPAIPTAADGHSVVEWQRLGRVVGRALALLPGDTRCLTQSLVLLRLLARRGVGGTLVIGVRPGDQFGAHAWVEVAERPLLPRGEPEYERLVEL